MTDPDGLRLDRDIARMLRTFEGPADPRPRRAGRPTRRTLLAMGLAVLVAGVAGVSVAFLEAMTDGRRAAISGPERCSELQAAGRVYVARRVPAGAVAAGPPLLGSAVLVCGGDRVPDAVVARVVGLAPELALVRPGEGGLVYVAEDRCRGAVSGADLVECLHKERSAP